MKPEPLEPILKMLAALMIFFTAMLFISERFFTSDGQIFQVISGLLTGISGAFLMRIKPRASLTPDSASTVTTTQTVASTQASPDEK